MHPRLKSALHAWERFTTSSHLQVRRRRTLLASNHSNRLFLMYGVPWWESAASVSMLARRVIRWSTCTWKATWSAWLFLYSSYTLLSRALPLRHHCSTCMPRSLVQVLSNDRHFAISWLATIMPTSIYLSAIATSSSQELRNI